MAPARRSILRDRVRLPFGPRLPPQARQGRRQGAGQGIRQSLRLAFRQRAGARDGQAHPRRRKAGPGSGRRPAVRELLGQRRDRPRLGAEFRGGARRHRANRPADRGPADGHRQAGRARPLRDRAHRRSRREGTAPGDGGGRAGRRAPRRERRHEGPEPASTPIGWVGAARRQALRARHPAAVAVVRAGSAAARTGQAGRRARHDCSSSSAAWTASPNCSQPPNQDGPPAPAEDKVYWLAWRSYFAGHSGDIYIHLAPHWYAAGSSNTTGHGTAHSEDRHVPICCPPGRPRGSLSCSRWDPMDIAPTLAAVLGIEPPLDCDCNVLDQALGPPPAHERRFDGVFSRKLAELRGDRPLTSTGRPVRCARARFARWAPAAPTRHRPRRGLPACCACACQSTHSEGAAARSRVWCRSPRRAPGFVDEDQFLVGPLAVLRVQLVAAAVDVDVASLPMITVIARLRC